jgi:outer membrane protein OmpA-like peptidoglycan-associated protein
VKATYTTVLARARTSGFAEADTAAAVRARDEAERQKREAQASALQQQQTAQAEAERNRAAAAAAAAASEQNSSRPSVNVRNSAPAYCNNSTPSSRLATRRAAWSSTCLMFSIDTGKHTLRPLAREKLAKISGIVLAYPTLTLGIEGNTDSVGSDAYNQGLSERRAEAVRIYLA